MRAPKSAGPPGHQHATQRANAFLSDLFTPGGARSTGPSQRPDPVARTREGSSQIVHTHGHRGSTLGNSHRAATHASGRQSSLSARSGGAPRAGAAPCTCTARRGHAWAARRAAFRASMTPAQRAARSASCRCSARLCCRKGCRSRAAARPATHRGRSPPRSCTRQSRSPAAPCRPTDRHGLTLVR